MHRATAIQSIAPSDWMQVALHDLCQPLTTLECQLFLGSLDPVAERAALQEAIRGALVQCARLRLLVRGMQDRMMESDIELTEQV